MTQLFTNNICIQIFWNNSTQIEKWPAFKIKRHYKSWVHTHNTLPRLVVLYLVLEIFLYLLHVLLLIWVWHLTPLMLVSLFIFILNPDNWHIDTTQSLCQCCRVEVKSKYFELNSFIIVSLSGVWRQVLLLLSVSPWIYQIQGVPKVFDPVFL